METELQASDITAKFWKKYERAELPLFSVERARALHLTSFFLSVLVYAISYEPISAQEFGQLL